MGLAEICPLISFKDYGDERGKLVVIEGGGRTIPFDIHRVFYIYGCRTHAEACAAAQGARSL